MPAAAHPDVNPTQAMDLYAGLRVPVQTPEGSLEVKTIDQALHRMNERIVYLLFTDGTSWAWPEDAPVLVVP